MNHSTNPPNFHLDNWVEDFLTGPERFWQRPDQMRATMRRSRLTESEIDSVIEEVEAARDSIATFVSGRAAGLFDADAGGCAL